MFCKISRVVKIFQCLQQFFSSIHSIGFNSQISQSAKQLFSTLHNLMQSDKLSLALPMSHKCSVITTKIWQQNAKFPTPACLWITLVWECLQTGVWSCLESDSRLHWQPIWHVCWDTESSYAGCPTLLQHLHRVSSQSRPEQSETSVIPPVTQPIFSVIIMWIIDLK